MKKAIVALPEDRVITRADAAAIVQIASAFESRIMIEQDRRIVNAKSMLGLLSLSGSDAEAELITQGSDAEAALQAVCRAFQEIRH